MFSKITGFGSLKAIIAVVLVLGVGGSAYALWSKYNNLANDNATLTATVTKLELATQIQDATINAQTAALEEWERASVVIQTKLQEIADGQTSARAERERLFEIFSEHDLAKLLDARPELVLRRINAGTDRAFSLLRCASGASDPDCASSDDTETIVTIAPETGTD